MIVGIGSDLCDIKRIEQTLDKFGERFVARCFTEIERRKSDRRAERAASYAKRFAAKEACAKALGTGLARTACSGATWAWSTCRRGAADDAADRRRRRAAGRDHAGRARRPSST